MFIVQIKTALKPIRKAPSTSARAARQVH
jgi:hypothetical protein